jgi:hypothetical protein
VKTTTKRTAITYRLCLKCYRAVPISSGELYCANDGERLLETCPGCGTGITSPYARYCVKCGIAFNSPALNSPVLNIRRNS